MLVRIINFDLASFHLLKAVSCHHCPFVTCDLLAFRGFCVVEELIAHSARELSLRLSHSKPVGLPRLAGFRPSCKRLNLVHKVAVVHRLYHWLGPDRLILVQRAEPTLAPLRFKSGGLAAMV